MAASPVEDLIRAGLAEHRAGRPQVAAARYRQALARDPNHADALHLLGLIQHQLGQSAAAAELIDRAVHVRPNLPPFWVNLAAVRVALGQDDRAADALTAAVRLDPAHADAHAHLAAVLTRLARLPQAVAAWDDRLRLRPGDADAHFQRGLLLWRLFQWGPSAAAFERALAIKPDHHEARRNLAGTLNALRRTDDAIAQFRRLLTAAPAALASPYHSNFLLALQYAPTPPTDALAESVRWAQTHGNVTPLPPPPAHVAGRRVRIGYASPDLRDHPVGRLIEPLLAGHDREHFEVHCYSDWPTPDPITRRLRDHVEHWHPTGGTTDAALADRIRADGIDLLVDLAGHTAGHRLLTLARRPAAVQATYLGYPATTGLPAIDYRLTDAVADPPGPTDAAHTERLVRLPGCFVCFAPPMDAPDVAPPPAVADGHVTFGSFNAAAKLSPATVALWANVLRTVPTARLVLKATGLQDVTTRDGLLAEFAAVGVDPGRVTVLPTEMDPRDHLARYAAVDVALDPTPYHGTMTTLDALWMGVPTVTLAGQTHVSRVGATLLTHAGLPEFIAGSVDEYVAIAARWAGEVAALAAVRSTMRDRVRSSPLADAAAFVRSVEAAYGAMVANPF